MSSTPRVPKAEITGLYGYVLKRFTRKMLGDGPEPAAVMWHNRPVLASFTGFGRKAQKWDRLDPNLKSFAHMALPALVGCSWCLDIGYFHAHDEPCPGRSGPLPRRARRKSRPMPGQVPRRPVNDSPMEVRPVES